MLGWISLFLGTNGTVHGLVIHPAALPIPFDVVSDVSLQAIPIAWISSCKSRLRCLEGFVRFHWIFVPQG